MISMLCFMCPGVEVGCGLSPEADINMKFIYLHISTFNMLHQGIKMSHCILEDFRNLPIGKMFTITDVRTEKDLKEGQTLHRWRLPSDQTRFPERPNKLVCAMFCTSHGRKARIILAVNKPF